MRIALSLACVAVVVGATACGSSDTPDAGGTTGPAVGSTAPTPTSSGNCIAAKPAVPASSLTGPVNEEVLASTDPSCATAAVSVTATGVSENEVDVAVGGTVAISYSEDVDRFQVGLEKSAPRTGGTVQIYRFTKDGHFPLSIDGAVVGNITAGNPSAFPNPLSTTRSAPQPTP